MNSTRLLQICGAALAGALALATPASAQTASAGAPGEWLTRYTSARTLGLGSAYVATADDALGVLWNPAGLSSMDQNEVRFDNARLFDETSVNAFGFAVPGSWLPSLALTVVSLNSGSFERTDEMNNPLGSFHEGETAYLFTASHAFSTRFALGTNLKLAQQTVEDFNGTGFGADLGATFQVIPALRIGVTMMNLGGPSIRLRSTDEAWPTSMRGGAALTLFDGRGLIAAEVDQSKGLGATFHAGGEYWIQPTVALRAGLNDAYATGGMSVRFTPQYTIDYAISNNPLGLTHRVGIAYRFGGFFASSKAEPAMFSPTGDQAVTRISLNARTKAEPSTWTLDIVNKSDETVRRFGGQGQPPSHLQWDGKDENGMPLPDGNYRYTLVVHDKVGRQVAGPTHIVAISTSGPQGTVPLVKTTEDGGNP